MTLKRGLKTDAIKPRIKPNTNTNGKNCLTVAGKPNFLFTKGLNRPY